MSVDIRLNHHQRVVITNAIERDLQHARREVDTALTVGDARRARRYTDHRHSLIDALSVIDPNHPDAI